MTLSDAEFAAALSDFEHTAFRLEVQRAYREPSESETVARFLVGTPEPPTTVEGLREWFNQVTTHVAQGKRMERVRVHEDPPTDYQRWERWIGRWNAEAGELIHYLTRARAHEIGLLPAAGDQDFWLLDSSKLIVMAFDHAGNRIRSELITDPAMVVRANAWRDLALHFSLPGETRDVVA